MTSLHASEESSVLAGFSTLENANLEKVNPFKTQVMPFRLIRISLSDFHWAATPFDQSSISLLAMENSQLVNIPFSLDRETKEGWLIFNHLDEANKRQGQDDKPSLDHKLLFSFFLKKAGVEKISACPSCIDKLNSAVILNETEVKLGNEVRYVYWVKKQNINSTLRSTIDFNVETNQLKTPVYFIAFNPRNYLDIQSFSLGDGHNKIDIDALKIRISGDILLGLSKLVLNNQNLKAKLIASYQQPVRTVLEMSTHVVIAGIPIMEVKIQAHAYENSIVFFAEVMAPSFVNYTYWNTKLYITLDGVKDDFAGAQVTPGGSHLHAGTVDGVLSQGELDFHGKVVSTENQWMFINHPYKAFQIYFKLRSEQEPSRLIRLIYQDDYYLVNKPEHFRGQAPNFGFLIDTLNTQKSGAFVSFSLNFSRIDGLSKHDEDIFIQKLNSTLEVTHTKLPR